MRYQTKTGRSADVKVFRGSLVTAAEIQQEMISRGHKVTVEGSSSGVRLIVDGMDIEKGTMFILVGSEFIMGQRNAIQYYFEYKEEPATPAPVTSASKPEVKSADEEKEIEEQTPEDVTDMLYTLKELIVDQLGESYEQMTKGDRRERADRIREMVEEEGVDPFVAEGEVEDVPENNPEIDICGRTLTAWLGEVFDNNRQAHRGVIIPALKNFASAYNVIPKDSYYIENGRQMVKVTI